MFDLIRAALWCAEPNLSLLRNPAIGAARVEGGRIKEVVAGRASAEDAAQLPPG